MSDGPSLRRRPELAGLVCELVAGGLQRFDYTGAHLKEARLCGRPLCPEALLKAARVVHVETVIRPYLQAVL